MANQGLTTGSVWVGTEAGVVDTHAVKVKTIVFTPAAANDVCELWDGANSKLLIPIICGSKDSRIIHFGDGKTFSGGLYLHSITSGAKISLIMAA